MSAHGFSVCCKRLAIWLSFLALGSALLAPAALLAREMGAGQWTGLCSGGTAAGTQGQAPEDKGHCELCVFPGLVPLATLRPDFGLPQWPEGAQGEGVQPAETAGLRPAIRGPPSMS